MDYKLKKKGFLTEKLSNSGFAEGQGILHDLKFLIPNTETYSLIKTKELSTPGSYPFETYKEAFYYFTKKLIEKDYPEAYLSQALFENNKAKVKENVTKYLGHTKSKHKNYAMNYMNNTLGDMVSNNKKEIILIPKVKFL